MNKAPTIVKVGGGAKSKIFDMINEALKDPTVKKRLFKFLRPATFSERFVKGFGGNKAIRNLGQSLGNAASFATKHPWQVGGAVIGGPVALDVASSWLKRPNTK